MYGIYYDDTEYDYMQHLKPTRDPKSDEDNNKKDDAVRIEAPKPNETSEIELPAAVLPSSQLLQRNYQNQQNIPDAIARFQPDMDPNLREVLELLEEDSDEELSKYVYRDEEDEIPLEAGEGGGDADSWFHQIVAQGEAPKPQRRPQRRDDAEYDETLTTITRTTRKGRKTKASRAASTNFSMTSSALYRTEGLTTLDDRFDMIQEEYAEDSEDDEADDDVNSNNTARLKNKIDPAQFEAIMDEFLLDQKVVGKRLQNVPRDSTPVSQLDDLRKTMGSTKIK